MFLFYFIASLLNGPDLFAETTLWREKQQVDGKMISVCDDCVNSESKGKKKKRKKPELEVAKSSKTVKSQVNSDCVVCL